MGMDLLQVGDGGASPEQSEVLEGGGTVGHASDVWLVVSSWSSRSERG